MYELLVGAVPFSGASLADLCVAVLMNVHPSITAQRQDVPPALEAIVNRCLAKDAAARFTTAAELANALRALETLSMAPGPKPSAPPAPLLADSSGPNPGRGVSPTEAMTINPVTTSQLREWTVPKTPIAVFVVGGILTMLVGGAGLFAIGKLGNKSADATNADSAVGLVAAPAAVEAGVIPATPIAPLPSAPAALPAAAKSAPHSTLERPVTVRPPRAQPVASVVPVAPAPSPPALTTKSHAAAADGPPPINFERR
jgi:serine/threonine-protein kinase